MAPNGVGEVEELSIDEIGSHQFAPRASEKLVERLSHEVFKYDHLDRRLKRHHITLWNGDLNVGSYGGWNSY